MSTPKPRTRSPRPSRKPRPRSGESRGVDARQELSASARPSTARKPKPKKITASQDSAPPQPRPKPIPQLSPKLVRVPAQSFDPAQRDKRLVQARKRLGVTPDQMRTAPVVRHILEHADGGLATAIAALRLSGEDEAQAFLAKYDGLAEEDRRMLTVEEISVAAGVGPKRLLEMCVSALVEDGQSAGQIVAASYHPRVIAATARNALTPWGDKDRKTFLTGTGFMPRPETNRGGVFHQTNIQQNIFNEGDGNTGDGAGTGVSDGEGLPSMSTHLSNSAKFQNAEDDLEKFHQLIDGAKMLQAPKTITKPAGAVQEIIGHSITRGQDNREMECIPSK